MTPEEKAAVLKRIEDFEFEGREIAKEIKSFDPDMDGISANIVTDQTTNLANVMRHCANTRRYERGETVHPDDATR